MFKGEGLRGKIHPNFGDGLKELAYNMRVIFL